MVLLGVCAFCLPYMPGNPPFLMLKTGTWLNALLTSHLLLSCLCSMASLRLGLDSFLAKGRLRYRSSNAKVPKNLHLGATTTRSI